jgi:dipeptidyl aminopeptidase/acylaminoacyl peptidase
VTGRALAVLAALALLGACGGESESSAPSSSATGAAETGVTETTGVDQATFAYEAAAPLGLRVGKVEKRAGAKVEDVVFSAPGGDVPAYLVRPLSGPATAAVLFLHWYEPASKTSNRTEFLEDAEALAAEGIVSLLPEQRFPWHEGPSDPEHDRQAVIDQVVDVRKALDLLASQRGVDPKRIAVVGHDYGGMYGALLAGFDGRPSAYVLMAIDTDFPNWFLKYFVRSGSASDYERAFAGLNPEDVVGKAAPAAVFLQFAETDQYVPLYKTDELFEAAGEPKRMELYGGGHELDATARRDRLAWLRAQFDLGSRT